MKQHAKRKALITTLGSLALSLSTFSAAWAADAVVEEDPAPPEPVVEVADTSGWYIAGRIGAAFADDSKFNTLGTQVTNSYDVGYNLSAAVGYEFKNGAPLSYRTEAEVGYMMFDIDKHNVAGVGVSSGANAFGETNSFYGLANGYIDYELGTITPFIGAGIGYASLDFSNHGTTGTGTVLNDSGAGLAWQVGAGAAYSLSDTLKIDLGYRYMGIENVSLTATDATSTDVDFRNHQVTLGIRKAF